MTLEKNNMPIGEKVEIFSTDDDKIKAVGEMLTVDASRTILKLLFTDTLTANHIAQKTGMSLQLVRYHLKKMQDLGLVEISKIGKNTKSHDMKYYSATKFAIVIVPSNISDKAKSSKSLLRSFKSIYRFAAIGIAAVASWFGTMAVQGIHLVQNGIDNVQDSVGSQGGSGMEYSHVVGGGTGTLEEQLRLARAKVAAVQVNPHAGSGTPLVSHDLILPLMITVSVIVAGFVIEIILRTRKYPTREESP
ncbi:MAG: winged helix-turn-helix transcriptional regulator [Thaumarchaeota archaeon]|nr:winged helix-turn-helix transcriptional regulator [Nitrososphaerota archaeon]MDE1838456.1 winged helix-turn-helix transcriptional regulator [Nitrososphaerota archaeon]